MRDHQRILMHKTVNVDTIIINNPLLLTLKAFLKRTLQDLYLKGSYKVMKLRRSTFETSVTLCTLSGKSRRFCSTELVGRIPV